MALWREDATESLKTLQTELKKEIETEEKDIKKQNVENPKWYPPRPWCYWAIVGTYLALQVAVALWSFGGFFYGKSWTPDLGVPLNGSLVVMVLQSFHLWASLQQIGVDRLAGISFFGRPLYAPTSGPYVVPFGILTLISAERNYKDKRFPGPADSIFRVSSDLQKTRATGDMPEKDSGHFRPIFVTTGEPKFTDDDRKEHVKNGVNPLDQQLNIEVAYFVRYRPHEGYDGKHAGIFRIARNLSAITGDIDKRIQDLIQEQSERDIKSIIAQLTPATIIENWGLFNDVFALKLTLSVMRLGIDIDKRSGLDDLNPSRDTNEAQAETARAMFRKTAAITTAEAEKQKKILEGQGAASAVQSGLEALAAGYKKIKDEAGIDGASVVASETAKAALGDKTVVLGMEGVTQLFGLVKAGQSILTPTSPPTAPTAAPTGTNNGRT